MVQRLKVEKPRIEGLPAWRLKRALVFVDLNLRGRITLPLLAQAAGLSRMHFARLFRRSTGLRPHEYVLHRRVGRAKDLMIHSNDSIGSIAQACGFFTQAHFANVFNRVVGQPPSLWRRATFSKSIGGNAHNIRQSTIA